MEFKDQLKKLRVEHHLTQKELGDIVFVSRSAIAKYENGKGYPSEETLKLLNEYFNTELVINDSKKNETPPRKMVIICTAVCTLIVAAALCLIGIYTKPYKYHKYVDNTVKTSVIYINYLYRDSGFARLMFDDRVLGDTLKDKIEIPEYIAAGDMLVLTHTGQISDVNYDYSMTQVLDIWYGKLISYEFMKTQVIEFTLEENQSIQDKVEELKEQYDIYSDYIMMWPTTYHFVTLDRYGTKDYFYMSVDNSPRYDHHGLIGVGALYGYNPHVN